MKTHLLTKWLPAMKPLAVALALCGAMPANATLINFEDTTDSIPGVVTFPTTGADMVGMTVQAIFASGLDETRNWAFISTGEGGVSSTTPGGWGLSVSGNTTVASWQFVNTTQSSLVSLILDGRNGFTLFDTDFPDLDGLEQVGTTGSSFGLTFDDGSGDADNGNVATYSRPVKLDSATDPVGDLFHVLTVDFGPDGLAGDWSFIQDTDNSEASRSVPEPATLALTMLGLAGLGLARRRKAQG